MPANVIETFYTERSSIKADFADGSLPGWLASQVNGGTVSVSQAGLGSATITSGASFGDSARVRGTTGYVPQEADAIGFRLVFELDSAAASSGDAVVLTGLADSADDDVALHFVNSDTDSERAHIRTSTGGTTTHTQARIEYPLDPIETEIIFDPQKGWVLHRYQNTFSARATDNLPDPSLALEPDVYIENKNGGTDRTVTIHEMEVTFYDSKY